MKVVLCGTAAGNRSAQLRKYYAGRGNQFWSILHKVGLTPRELDPSKFRELAEYDIGLTDLAQQTSGPDKDHQDADFDVEGFRERIEHFAPRAVAFNGKRAAKQYFGREKVDYGRQPETIGDTAIFVLPSTSGAARGYWDESYWYEVADFVKVRE